jgi:hypothetical protein
VKSSAGGFQGVLVKIKLAASEFKYELFFVNSLFNVQWGEEAMMMIIARFVQYSFFPLRNGFLSVVVVAVISLFA